MTFDVERPEYRKSEPHKPETEHTKMLEALTQQYIDLFDKRAQLQRDIERRTQEARNKTLEMVELDKAIAAHSKDIEKELSTKG